MMTSSNFFVPFPSPTSANLSEDPNLWLSAHCEFLERKQKEYASLNREIEMLSEINNDLEKIVNSQRPLLNEMEEHVSESLRQSRDANSILISAYKFQGSSVILRTGICLTIGTMLGSGIGSFGLLFGIKPILALSIGGGLGAFVSGIASIKID